jgi:hypothetical protein
LDNERCVVETDGLFEMWKSFFPSDSDEVALLKRLTASLNHLEKLKFVRSLPSDANSWEVRKLLKARIPVEELETLRDRLAGVEGA